MKQNTTYKQTELGLIPEDWEVKKLGEILKEYSLGGNYENNSEESGIPLIKMGNIGRGKIDLSKIEYLPKNVNYSKNDILKYNDILFNTRNTLDLVGKVSIWKNEALFALYNSNLLRLYFKEDFVENNDYVNFQFNSEITLANLKKYATGTTSVAAIYTKDLLKLKFLLPPLPEQKKIADCLSTWDCAIEKQSALINALTDRKKALMQQLLTGKKRLPGFSGEWKEVSFEKLLKQIKRKEEWDDNKLYKLLSVKRRSEGIFDREHLFGYQIAVKELMKVKKDDFLISKMQIVHGASALVNDYFENYYVSGSYIVLNIRDKRILNPEFLNYYSKQKLFYYQTYLSSYGVHIEKMTFDFKTFLKIEMTIPSLEEQTAIAEILATADRELQLQKDKLAQLQSQKKGLMQVLLTGKKRLIN